jgi:hypothetical protein
VLLYLSFPASLTTRPVSRIQNTGDASYSGDDGGSWGTKILVKEQTFGASNVKGVIGHLLEPVVPNSHHNLIP